MLASVLGRHGVPSQDPWLHSDPWSAAGNVLAGSEELPGLEQWLSRLRLEAHGDAIRSWAAEMGAVSLEECAAGAGGALGGAVGRLGPAAPGEAEVGAQWPGRSCAGGAGRPGGPSGRRPEDHRQGEGARQAGQGGS
ncbi:unnamed protein product [Effrenium voratum]|uniref:Uncharacterized protein n=1 Tax=Effrenium voratum TaxID=2562239 RepID=A0AA36NAC5_9DINO|nr:unnamed protein product [Effrenium voratum]